MKIFLQKNKNILPKHWLAILVSILVGIIYIAPHLFFIVSNNDVYQGIPLMQVANEDFYLARMQEVVDGHPLLGSPAHFEYKDQFPIAPPTIELLYALPTLIFGTSLVATLTLSKFILPLLLFLLVYILIYRLLGEENRLHQKISAIAGALFIILGYDLINYANTFAMLTGVVEPTGWLIWTRPVNPIMGGIFLFSFLILLWSVIENTKKIKTSIFGAGFFLALAFSSYFFSWGIALSILAMLGLFYLIKRDFLIVRRIIYIFILGLGISSPYWYLSWQAKQSAWYQVALLKNGIFYTHYPLLNKVLIASLVVYLVFLVIKLFKNFNLSRLENRDFFPLAFLLGGLFAFNQQVITGVTIWPFHFVQYTIPLSIIAMIVVLYRVMYKHWKVVWIGSIGIIILASFWFGIYTQYGTYVNFLERNKSVQSYAPVFDWFNQQEQDCVVLVSGDRRQFKVFSGMILAFTHCDQYSTDWGYSLMPQERIHHSLLVNLRFRDVTTDGLEEYSQENPSELRSYLFSNWAGLYNVSKFPDFQDLELPKRVERFPEDYRQFLEKDFETELNKYRLDYILSFKPLSQEILDQLPSVEFQEEVSGFHIYKY